MEIQKYFIYCDGGARGNPGPAACSFVIYLKGKLIYKNAKYLGITTNNVAEYKAVVSALEWLKKNKKNIGISIYLDSQLIVRQLNGLYKIKATHLKPLFLKIKNLEKYFLSIKFIFVKREKNKLADFLVNEKLDSVSRQGGSS